MEYRVDFFIGIWGVFLVVILVRYGARNVWIPR